MAVPSQAAGSRGFGCGKSFARRARFCDKGRQHLPKHFYFSSRKINKTQSATIGNKGQTKAHAASMAKIWNRLRRFVRLNGRNEEGERSPRAVSEPNIAVLLARLGETDSLDSQRALAPSSLVAWTNVSPATDRTLQTRSITGRSKTDSILLGWPEYQHARANREKLDEIVPQELQHSKVSCDLHYLTMSAQAGGRPYCEDVADRNISSSVVLHKAATMQYGTCPSQPNVIGRSGRKAGKPPCSYPWRTAATENRSFEYDRIPTTHVQQNRTPHTHPSAVNANGRRSKSAHVHTEPSTTIAQRRHSLPHKPNIFDLRSATEAEGCQSTVASPRGHRAGSETSRRSSLTSARLNAPLPSLPLPIPGPEQRSKQVLEYQQRPVLRRNFLEGAELEATDSQSDHVARATDTTVYERWAPAVTHERVVRNVHEIREEHIHKDVHNYHVRHLIQPIVDYRILPPRHFISDENGFREIDENDIPLEAPHADWYATEVVSQLDALKINEVPWDSGTDYISMHMYSTNSPY